MPAIILSQQQAEQLVAVLREATRTKYLDVLATLEDYDSTATLTAEVVRQIAVDK